MEDLIKGIKENKQIFESPRVEYSIAYAIGGMSTIAELHPNKVYTPAEILALLRAIDGGVAPYDD